MAIMMESRLPVLLIALDGLGAGICDTVYETVEATDRESLAFLRTFRAETLTYHEAFQALVSLTAGMALDSRAATVYLVGRLDGPAPETRVEAALSVTRTLIEAAGPGEANLSLYPRCLWLAGPYLAAEDASQGGTATTPAVVEGSNRPLHELLTEAESRLGQVLASSEKAAPLWQIIVMGTGPGGPTVADADELRTSAAVTLEALVLPTAWQDLGRSVLLRHSGLGTVGARMAQHPADEIARWVGERLLEDVLATFITTTQPQAPLLAWDRARLGSVAVASVPPPRHVRIGWFESRTSLLEKLATSQATFMGETYSWRDATAQQVQEHAAASSAHAHGVADDNVAEVHAAADQVLAGPAGGLSQAAAVVAQAATAATGASGGPSDTISNPPFPVTELLDTGPLEAEYQRLRRVAAALPESVALTVYALATYLLTVIAAWGPATQAYPGVRGMLFAVVGPMLVIGLVVGVYGLVKRRLLQRQVTLKLPVLQQQTLMPWAVTAQGVSEAVSARWQLRAMRQAAAALQREAVGLRRAVAVTQERLARLRQGPPTANALAATLTARTRGVRSALLDTAETVSLADEALAQHRVTLGGRAAVGLGSREDWAGERAERLLASLDQDIHEHCRDIAANGLTLSASQLESMLRERLLMSRPLAPFDRTDVALGAVEQSVLLALPDTSVTEVPSSVTPADSTIVPIASPNKVYVLRVWTELIPADFRREH